jgi:hypothetical protein
MSRQYKTPPSVAFCFSAHRRESGRPSPGINGTSWIDGAQSTFHHAVNRIRLSSNTLLKKGARASPSATVCDNAAAQYFLTGLPVARYPV